MSEPNASAPVEPAKQANRDDERLLEHNYDGIQEYDNPMPRWWVYIFWATIVWAILYYLNVPGIGTGKGRIANYEREMEVARQKYASQGGGPTVTNESLLAIASDPVRFGEGKTQFQTICAACHRPDGGGLIGPNLTDAYWLHGARPIDLYHTITTGVPDKGMPSWGQVLKPDQVMAVTAYVLSLRGTHPDQPKEPQGINADSAAAAQPGGAPTPEPRGAKAK